MIWYDTINLTGLKIIWITNKNVVLLTQPRSTWVNLLHLRSGSKNYNNSIDIKSK
jgi:hypothetical protein